MIDNLFPMTADFMSKLPLILVEHKNCE